MLIKKPSGAIQIDKIWRQDVHNWDVRSWVWFLKLASGGSFCKSCCMSEHILNHIATRCVHEKCRICVGTWNLWWANVKDEKGSSIGTILCTERRCCQSSLLGYYAQSWMVSHSDTGFSNDSIIPASWYSFFWPWKDDTLSKSHLVLNNRAGFELGTFGSQAVHLNH